MELAGRWFEGRSPTLLPSLPVIVGVDGSYPSRAALVWAAGQARLTGAHLLAVTAWEPSEEPGGALSDVPAPRVERHVQARLDQTIAEAVGDTDVKILTEVIRGDPAAALIEMSKAASLVVMGSRGRGTGRRVERLLGSAAERVVTHAHCPVVVVRDGAVGWRDDERA